MSLFEKNDESKDLKKLRKGIEEIISECDGIVNTGMASLGYDSLADMDDESLKMMRSCSKIMRLSKEITTGYLDYLEILDRRNKELNETIDKILNLVEENGNASKRAFDKLERQLDSVALVKESKQKN